MKIEPEAGPSIFGLRGAPAAAFSTGGGAVLAAALAVRIIALTREPMWLDEIFTDQFTGGGFGRMLHLVARDVHPPLYFAGLWAWRRLFHLGGAGLRSYGVLWGVVGVAAVMLLVRELGAGKRTALVAGLLLAMSPLDIYYAQEARPYVQAAALAALGTWLLVAWLRRRPAPGSWRWLAGFGLAVTAMVLTHYAAAAVAVAQGAAALAWLAHRRDGAGLRAFLAASSGAVAAFVPWALFALHGRGGAQVAERLSWIPAPSPGSLGRLLLRHLPLGLVPISSRLTSSLRIGAAALVVALCVAAWKGRRAGAGDGPPAGTFLGWMVLAPVAVAAAVSVLWRPVLFAPRFAELVVPFAAAWVAVAAARLRPRSLFVAVVALMVAGLVWADAVQVAKPQKRGMAGFVRLWRQHGPPDAVYFFPRWNRRVADYSFGRPVDVPSRAELARRLRGDRLLRIWVCTNLGYGFDASRGEAAESREILALGPHRELARVDGMKVVEVEAAPAPRSYPRLEPGQVVEAGTHKGDPFLWSGWWQPERTFRWSRGERSVIVFGLGDPARVRSLEIELLCYGKQRVKAVLNGTVLAEGVCDWHRPRSWAWQVTPGVLTEENTLVIEHPDAVSPAERGRSRDRRKLAVGLVRFAVR